MREPKEPSWIEGIRQFVQAFDAGHEFDTVIDSPVLLKVLVAEMLVRRLAARSVPRVRLRPEQFRSISTAKRASGVGAMYELVRQAQNAPQQ